ncbi:hypothetical protein PPTG_04418 [Phytophthora nicotianae INRA-310]|uniref:Uncharacterized protein n=1 Tax=Phytophthora nicotianae (strain INRA-310) TaxID=761204 RepID=W2R3B3_PHYN3|nr:hypothetical protein PPTG_04418 [Phytophthora nicotianae INRA-310]ETN18985.1 hypothetical protein PPTG_04418 [Phytophthora nicotianae INRA-310]
MMFSRSRWIRSISSSNFRADLASFQAFVPETQKPFTVHLNSIDGVKRLAILDQNVGKVSGSESSATGVESCRDNNSEDDMLEILR